MGHSTKRQEDRQRFGDAVVNTEVKIQIGARGQKIDPSWLSVDLFDNGPLIDRQWDLHCLPIEDNSVDCFMCNAILEHVQNPQLALFEMFRTLRSGGQIWIEVPFMQFYHAHPHDYYRWTLPGVRLLCADFYGVASGISVGAAHEVTKIMNYTSAVLEKKVHEKDQVAALDWFENYESKTSSPRCYSMVYFWGRKDCKMRTEKYDFLAWSRSEYVAKQRGEISYEPDFLLSREALRNS